MATSISSGLQVTSALIATGRNRINAITLITDGTNAATATIYDNTTNSGKVACKVTASGAQNTMHVIFENPVLVELGAYLVITGTDANSIVFFGG